MRGLYMDNLEYAKMKHYWFFAHFFNFTPDQVDSMPNHKSIYLQELEEEYCIMQKEANKDGV